MKRKQTYIFLFLIFLLGFFLRFYRLNLNLPELYIDETTGQYLMRLSVLHPNLSPNSIIQIYLYNLLSFTTILGLNPLGARSAAAFFSSLIPLAIFLFFTQVKHKSNLSIALIGAFLTAILPWSFLIGRISHVHIPIIVSLTCFSCFYFLSAKKLRHYLYSLFFLGLAAFYYPTIILIAPFISLLILYFASQALNQKQRQQLPFIILGLGVVILCIFFFKYQGFNLNSRGVDLAIWRDPNTIHDTNQSRGLSWLSQPGLFTLFTNPKQISPLAYNKVTANLTIFTHNYLSFFSPDWLFLRGDAILRHSTGQVGYFFPVLIPFLLYGIFRFFTTADQKTTWLFLTWIITTPLVAAMTKDGAGYLLRAITMLPFFTYFISLGLVDSLNFIKTKILKLLYCSIFSLLIIYSTFYFFFGYFHVYPYQTSTARAYEYGFKELSDFQIQNNNAKLLIIWDGYYPFGHFLFWQNIPPLEYTQYQFEDIVIGESHFYHPSPKLFFAKPYKTQDLQQFVQQYQPQYLILPDRYYVNYPSDLPDKSNLPVKVINYPNGKTNFLIYSLSSND